MITVNENTPRDEGLWTASGNGSSLVAAAKMYNFSLATHLNSRQQKFNFRWRPLESIASENIATLKKIHRHPTPPPQLLFPTPPLPLDPPSPPPSPATAPSPPPSPPSVAHASGGGEEKHGGGDPVQGGVAAAEISAGGEDSTPGGGGD